MFSTRRVLDLALLALIVGLTVATGYIHFWVGGTLLLLNAAGYAVLAGLVVITALVQRRALPLVTIALGGYAAATILGWAVMGPYFDVAYLAKAIEIALIITIVARLSIARNETRDSLRWARSLAADGILRLPRRAAPPSSSSAPAAGRAED